MLIVLEHERCFQIYFLSPINSNCCPLVWLSKKLPSPDIVVLALEKGLVCRALPNYPDFKRIILITYFSKNLSIILNIDENN